METTEAKQKLQEQEKEKERLKAEAKAEKEAKQGVSDVLYENYTKYKFMKLDGAQLRDDIEKEFQKLEKEIKECTGKKAKRTITIAFGSEIFKLVEGIPVPAKVFEAIQSKTKNPDRYF